ARGKGEEGRRAHGPFPPRAADPVGAQRPETLDLQKRPYIEMDEVVFIAPDDQGESPIRAGGEDPPRSGGRKGMQEHAGLGGIEVRPPAATSRADRLAALDEERPLLTEEYLPAVERILSGAGRGLESGQVQWPEAAAFALQAPDHAALDREGLRPEV